MDSARCKPESEERNEKMKVKKHGQHLCKSGEEKTFCIQDSTFNHQMLTLPDTSLIDCQVGLIIIWNHPYREET